MTKLILSTSNIMNGGPSIIRRPNSDKSNIELVNALRSNFLASKQAFAPQTNRISHGLVQNQTLNNGVQHVPYSNWTTRADNSLFVPAIDFSQSGLAEERSQYDITVKLFFLPKSSASDQCKHAQEAVDLVLRELHIPSIDLLIASFSDVSFDENDEDDREPQRPRKGEDENLDSIVDTWRTLENLHDKGIALHIGLSEFGNKRLREFLPRTRVRPSVDQINVRDCCVVPKSLMLYAKEEKIELLTHNDCTNILPEGTMRDLLGTHERGAGVLAGPDESPDGYRGDLEPQWVVKYTAVVRDRGVIENKGYFAMAEIRD